MGKLASVRDWLRSGVAARLVEAGVQGSEPACGLALVCVSDQVIEAEATHSCLDRCGSGQQGPCTTSSVCGADRLLSASCQLVCSPRRHNGGCRHHQTITQNSRPHHRRPTIPHHHSSTRAPLANLPRSGSILEHSTSSDARPRLSCLEEGKNIWEAYDVLSAYEADGLRRWLKRIKKGDRVRGFNISFDIGKPDIVEPLVELLGLCPKVRFIRLVPDEAEVTDDNVLFEDGFRPLFDALRGLKDVAAFEMFSLRDGMLWWIPSMSK